MQLTRVMGVALVLVGLLVVFGIIPIPGEITIAVDGNKPTAIIYIADGTNYKLVAVNDLTDQKISVPTSYNRIVVCYYDKETSVKTAKFGYSRDQIPAPAYLYNAETYLPYRDANMEYRLEKQLASEGYNVDVVCRYKTFSPSLGIRYGMRAQAIDEADNMQDTWGWVYYGKANIESYDIYFNGKLWDKTQTTIYVKPGNLNIKVVIKDTVWVDSISYTLKDSRRNILEQKIVKTNIQAPDTIEWTTTTSLEKGKTYYLTITAKVAGSDYTLASLQLPLIDLTQAQIQNTLMKPQTIIGIVITAIGAVLLVYPQRRT